MQIRADVKTISRNIVKNGILMLVGQRVYATELRVKIQALRGELFLLTVYLIKDVRGRRADVFNLNSEALEIRHFKVTVHALERVAAYSEAAYLTEIVVIRVCEEVAERRIDGGIFLPVKIYAEQKLSAPLRYVRKPDVLYRALTLNVGDNDRLACGDNNVGAYLPALTKLSCGVGDGAAVGDRHAAPSLCARRVFGGDGKAPYIFFQCKLC